MLLHAKRFPRAFLSLPSLFARIPGIDAHMLVTKPCVTHRFPGFPAAVPARPLLRSPSASPASALASLLRVRRCSSPSSVSPLRRSARAVPRSTSLLRSTGPAFPPVAPPSSRSSPLHAQGPLRAQALSSCSKPSSSFFSSSRSPRSSFSSSCSSSSFSSTRSAPPPLRAQGPPSLPPPLPLPLLLLFLLLFFSASSSSSSPPPPPPPSLLVAH